LVIDLILALIYSSGISFAQTENTFSWQSFFPCNAFAIQANLQIRGLGGVYVLKLTIAITKRDIEDFHSSYSFSKDQS